MTPKDEPLKPCAFCGTENPDLWFLPDWVKVEPYGITCRTTWCGAMIRLKTKEAVIYAWNTRRALPITEQEREALEWADEVVIYEPGAKRGHLKAAVLAALVRRLTSPDKEKYDDRSRTRKTV